MLSIRLFRPALPLVCAALLAACANGANLGDRRPELGDFRLSHNIVVADNAVRGPLSREGDPDEIEEVLRAEIARRFARYEGERLYHIAIAVDAYVFAMPGIPLAFSPRSALIVGVHVWDDQLGRPINEERRQFTVLEHMSGSTVLGSGLTQSADQQLQVLARNAALVIENWMADNPEWFSHPGTGSAASAPAPAAASGPAAAPAAAAAPAEEPVAAPEQVSAPAAPVGRAATPRRPVVPEER